MSVLFTFLQYGYRGLFALSGTIAVRVHVVMLRRDRCPGVPTSDLYLLCVCLSV